MGREEVEEVKRGARGEEKVRRQRLKMMADNGVKPHTTVTVTTQSGLAPQDSQPMEIRLNIGYFKSFQGIIKIVQLDVIKIVCTSKTKWFLGSSVWLVQLQLKQSACRITLVSVTTTSSSSSSSPPSSSPSSGPSSISSK